MLGHCKMILERDGGRIAINPDKFDKLITALGTAVDIDGTRQKRNIIQRYFGCISTDIEVLAFQIFQRI